MLSVKTFSYPELGCQLFRVIFQMGLYVWNPRN